MTLTPSEDEGSVSLFIFILSSCSVIMGSTGSMMCGVLGGVRRHGGSRADILTSLLVVSWICTSRYLSFWDKRMALHELNLSKQWVERGEWREGGDGGKAERGGWLWTVS